MNQDKMSDTLNITANVAEEIMYEVNCTDLEFMINFTFLNCNDTINVLGARETPEFLVILLTVFAVTVFNFTCVYLYFFWKSHTGVSVPTSFRSSTFYKQLFSI